MIYTLGFLSMISTVLLAFGWLIAEYMGLLFFIMISLLLFFLSLIYSEKIVIRIIGAKKMNNERLDKIIDKLSREAIIKKPKLFAIESRIPNSLVTGRSKSNSSIVVTDGLMDLSEDEIEGVLAHQIGHIKREDMILYSAIVVVSHIISYIAQKAYWAFVFGNNKINLRKILGVIIISIFSPIPVIFIRVFINPRLDYRADHAATFLTRKPMELASALRKMECIAKHEKMKVSVATSHLWIINPFEKDSFVKLFDAHPPIKNRIYMLESHSNRSGREKEIIEYGWGLC